MVNLWIERKTLFPLSRRKEKKECDHRAAVVLLVCVFSSAVFRRLEAASSAIFDFSVLACFCWEVAPRTEPEPEQAELEMLVSALTETRRDVTVCATERLKLDLLSNIFTSLKTWW